MFIKNIHICKYECTCQLTDIMAKQTAYRYIQGDGVHRDPKVLSIFKACDSLDEWHEVVAQFLAGKATQTTIA